MGPLKKAAYNLLNSAWPMGIRYNGHRLWGWKPIKIWYPHEPETVAFIRSYVKPGMTVGDVGANVGFYTLLLSDLVGKDGHVVAYEPDAKSYARLQKAVRYRERERGWSNIELRKCAVGAKAATRTLYGEGGGGQNSVAYEVGPALYEVAVEPLDPKIQFAKIDVEGHEVDVLQGMQQKIPCTVEYSRTIFKRTGESGNDYVDTIRALGYRIYVLKKDSSKNLLEGYIPAAESGHVNLFLEPA